MADVSQLPSAVTGIAAGAGVGLGAAFVYGVKLAVDKLLRGKKDTPEPASAACQFGPDSESRALLRELVEVQRRLADVLVEMRLEHQRIDARLEQVGLKLDHLSQKVTP